MVNRKLVGSGLKLIRTLDFGKATLSTKFKMRFAYFPKIEVGKNEKLESPTLERMNLESSDRS